MEVNMISYDILYLIYQDEVIHVIYKLQPQFLDKMWGGNKLKTAYQYNTSNHCGEAWGISGYDHFSSIIMNGTYKGLSLNELFQAHKELFGNYNSSVFPILVKVIDATDDLSIQVHPDNEYAKKHHKALGKTECWYILDAEENTDIIIGHKALNKNEFKTQIQEKRYHELLNRFPIKKEEVFHIPAGTIHGICKGTLLLEVQQSSDITYRFYDYDRLFNGEPRELHQKQAIEVTNIPSKKISHSGDTAYFSFKVLDIEESNLLSDQYGDYYFIIEGQGYFDSEFVKKGDFLFIPSKTNYHIKGSFKVGYIRIK